MKICCYTVLLVLLLISSHSTAATYYVSAQGDDANDGLSKERPWRSIQPKVNGITFQPGDTILFRKGDVWYDQLLISSSGEKDNPITFSSYGTADAMPRIEGRDWGTRNFGNVTIRVPGEAERVEHLVLDGLDITGKFAYGIYMVHTTNLTIRNSHIHHHGQVYEQDPAKVKGHCIASKGYQIDTRIVNNEIDHCTVEGIMIKSENIEIAYNHIHHVGLEQTMGITPFRNSFADVIQLNCWSPGYWVHDNILDRRGSDAGKGVFISSHCTYACYQSIYAENPRPPGEPKCLDGDWQLKQLDKEAWYSGGVFENNTCIAGPRNGFGWTNSGYGDVVRNNTFVSHVADEPDLPLFGLRSEHGVVAYNNSWKGFKHAVETSKAGGRYYFYNNIIDLYDSSQPYHVVRSGTNQDIQFLFKNNIFLDRFSYNSLNSNHLIRLAGNVFTAGHTPYDTIVIDEGDNLEIDIDTLKVKDWPNNNGTLMADSPLIDTGLRIMEHPVATLPSFQFAVPEHRGALPDRGVDASAIGVTPGVQIGPLDN